MDCNCICSATNGNAYRFQEAGTGSIKHANCSGEDIADGDAGNVTDAIETSCDNSLDNAIPGSPTSDSINERFKTLDDAYTVTRAAYLDELAAANIPTDVDTLISGHGTIVANQTALAVHLVDIKGTGFVKDTDSMVDLAHIGADGDTMETLSDQMDGITGGAGGEGAYTGTLTVDDGSTGLEGAVVAARRGGVLKASGTTDSSGEITDWVFGAYTYDLAVSIAGYQPGTDTITVSADAWTKTISLTAISITAPGAASLCTVQFRVKLSDTAVSGAVCKAKILGINQASDGTILSNEESSDTTDANGVAELALVRKDSIAKGSGRYKIWVAIAGQPVASVETTIPAQSTILFEDLIGA